MAYLDSSSADVIYKYLFEDISPCLCSPLSPQNRLHKRFISNV